MFGHYREKPLPHYTLTDWKLYNRNLENVTEKKNIIANNVRQETQQIRNATSNTMSWMYKNTNEKLRERLNEVDQWLRNLDRTLRDLTDTVGRLSEAKLEVERTLADNLPLLEAGKESMSLRDRRREIDLVDDDPYHELKKEVDIIETRNNDLRKCSREAWDHLVQLKEQRDKLQADMDDKELATKIDKFQLSLTPASTNVISFKPWPADACSAGDCPVSLETWLQNCTDKRRNAEDAVARAIKTTNDAWTLIRKSNDEISFAREATEFALKKRRHDTLNTRDSLAAQRKDLLDEIDRLDKEMLTLERSIDGTRGSLKLIHTRLESRKSRQRMELCRDFATIGLEEELRHAMESREHLMQELRDLKNLLNGVQQHLREVEDDLQRKERSLAIETTCMEVHGRPGKSPYQTDIAWLAPIQSSSPQYLYETVKRGANQRILDRIADANSPHVDCDGHHRQKAIDYSDEYRLVD